MRKFLKALVAAAWLAVVPASAGTLPQIQQWQIAPYAGTSATNTASNADRATKGGTSFDVVIDFGAKCDGTTDDATPINAALTAAGAVNGRVSIPPGKLCRSSATIAVPGGTTFDLGGYQPGNPVSGGGIICDAGVSPCVSLGSSTVNDPAALENGVVTRTGGEPPTSGSTRVTGIQVFGYHTTITKVLADNHSICYQFSANNPVGAGIHHEVFGGSAQRCSDAYIDDVGTPEIYWIGGRLGMNGPGDYSSNTYVRTEGPQSTGAGSPGTVSFTSVHFNSGSLPASHFWEFVNLGSPIPTADATSYSVIGGHVENVSNALFYSDSSWNTIDRTEIDSVVFNTPNAKLFDLNAATGLAEWDVSSSIIECAATTIAPNSSVVWQQVNFTGGKINCALTLTSSNANQTWNFNGTNFGGSLTINGPWYQFNLIAPFFSLGAFVNNSTAGTVNFIGSGATNKFSNDLSAHNITAAGGSLTVSAPAGNPTEYLNAASGYGTSIAFQQAGSNKWLLTNTSSNQFDIQDSTTGLNAIACLTGGNCSLGETDSSLTTFNGMAKLQTSGALSDASFTINSATGRTDSILLQENGTTKWQIAKTNANAFFVLDATTGYTSAIQIAPGGNVTLGEGGTNLINVAGLLKLQSTTIASLPTCNSGTAGEMTYVSNGVASPTYNGTVSTTGSSNDLVFCNGSNWTYH